MEWLEQIKKKDFRQSGLEWVGGIRVEFGFFLLLGFLFKIDTCSLRKIREWISLSYRSILSSSSIQSKKKNLQPTNPDPKHLPHKSTHLIFQQKNNTSGDNSKNKNMNTREWLSFHPKEMLKKVIMPSVLLLFLCAGGWGGYELRETHA